MNLGNGYGYVGNNPWTYVDPMGLAMIAMAAGKYEDPPMSPRLAGVFMTAGGILEMAGGYTTATGSAISIAGAPVGGGRSERG